MDSVTETYSRSAVGGVTWWPDIYHAVPGGQCGQGIGCRIHSYIYDNMREMCSAAMEGREWVGILIVVVVNSSGTLLCFAISNFTHFHRSRKGKKRLDVRWVLWTGAIYGSEGWRLGKVDEKFLSMSQPQIVRFLNELQCVIRRKNEIRRISTTSK